MATSDGENQRTAVVVLAGGIGAARFLVGLRSALAGADAEVTVIGNTADDITLHGLHISPDLDTVMYTLGGGVHPDQGWGRSEETFSLAEELARYGVEPDWFTLGDRDLATHVIRTQMLSAGYPLAQVTEALSRRWLGQADDPRIRLLPMSEDRMQTHIVTDVGSGTTAIHFQEWWVRYRARPVAERIVVVGADTAGPAPGVIEALSEADVILIPPSNPVVSIGPILAVPGVRAALVASDAPVVGVSPIIGGRPVRGMADACLSAIGVRTAADAVAELYQDFLDGWLLDDSDRELIHAVADIGVDARSLPLLMTDESAAARIARAALDLAADARR